MGSLTAAVFLLGANALSFFLMACDKDCARKNKRRIPEKILFLSALMFGGLGGVLGMKICRHKTKHLKFKIFFPLIFLCQAAILLHLGFFKG